MATGCTLRPTTDPQSCQKMSDVKQQRTAAFVLRHWSLQKSHAAPYAWSESLLPCGGEGDRRPDEGDDRHHVLRGNKATVVHSGKRTSRICRSANGRVESATAGEDRPAMGGETTAPSQHAQPWHFFREDHGVCSSGGEAGAKAVVGRSIDGATKRNHSNVLYPKALVAVFARSV